MLSTVRRLSSTRRDEVIRTACDRCGGLEILVSREGRIVKHWSRFLRAPLRDSGLHLVVEMAVVSGKALRYRYCNGEDVEAIFHVGGERYAFSTKVVGRCVHELNEEKKVPALVLAYPAEVENRQRRAHYRVPLGTASPVSIAFVEAPDGEGMPEIPRIYSGHICDISAAGVAVLSLQRLSVSIGIGSHLLTSFRVPDEPEWLNLEAVVRNVRPTDTPEARILGLEFVHQKGDVQSRRHIDLVQRFVVRRQREILRKLRML